MFIASLSWLTQFYYRAKKPHPEIYAFQYAQNQWKLMTPKGELELFSATDILIHNILFQVLKLTGSKKNKIIILFNDQLTSQQLRILHLKAEKF
jgi:hypothetical protein